MNRSRTIYHLIVDRSGSMSDCIDATINGFNEQIRRIRAMEVEFPEQEVRVGLTLFDHRIDQIRSMSAVSEMNLLDRGSYVPDGRTSLLDAIGQTVTHLQDWQRRHEEVDSTFVVVVLTDGHENSSQCFNLEEVRALISALESTGKWTFSFMGATLDAMEVARAMAFKKQNSFAFNKSSMKSDVWEKLSGSMNQYFHKKRIGKDLSDLFD